jgi:hypothetical protein
VIEMLFFDKVLERIFFLGPASELLCDANAVTFVQWNELNVHVIYARLSCHQYYIYLCICPNH